MLHLKDVYVLVVRPGVAGAVLQTASSFINSLIDQFSEPFPKISSYYHKSQTVRARELKLRECSPPPNMSRVACRDASTAGKNIVSLS